MTLPEIAACGLRHWNAQRGDPALTGLLFVWGYLSAGVLTGAVALRSRGRERGLLAVASALLLFQVLNTPLDLHLVPVYLGRCLMFGLGLKDSRQAAKLVLVAAALVILLLLLVIGLYASRRYLRRNAGILAGLGLILASIVMKLGDHHLDDEVLVRLDIGPFDLLDIVELAGILLSVLAASLRLVQARRSD